MRRVVPAIHVKGGRLARREGMRWVAGGEPAWCPDGDAEKAARRLHSLFGEVCIIDRDGLSAGQPDLELLDRLGRSGVAFWSDAGPRHVGDFMDISFVGAQGVTVRCGWMSPEEVQDALEVTDVPLYLGVALPRDARDLPRYRHLVSAATGLVLIAHRVEGTREGFPQALLQQVPDARGLYVQGGIRDEAEARRLLDHGVEAVIVDAALRPDPEAWGGLAAAGSLGETPTQETGGGEAHGADG